jgi:hypothetical protein
MGNFRERDQAAEVREEAERRLKKKREVSRKSADDKLKNELATNSRPRRGRRRPGRQPACACCQSYLVD